MGLGLFGGGSTLTRFLCNAGAEVVVTDLRDAETLKPSIVALGGLPVRWALGGHRDQDFLDADMVFANPAVPRDVDILQRCSRKGVTLETEMNLFFKLCPGKICAITGSNGKTTTTLLTASIAEQASARARVGGNLGISLLGEIGDIVPTDWVVLELSSFQLEDLRALDRRPEVSLVTNLSPNHLNRHGTYASYIEAKRVIFDDGPPGCHAIVNGDDAVLREWATKTNRDVIYYGQGSEILPRSRGVWAIDKHVYHAHAEHRTELFHQDEVELTGRFNLVNAAGAAAAALAMGCTPDEIHAGVRKFRPAEHRLEFVREVAGVRYYNDSIATTPESTLCAIDALGPGLVLIAGGSDKGNSFTRLGHAMARRTRGAVLIGKTADAIEQAIRTVDRSLPVFLVSSLDEAVLRAHALARPGDAVALSPACASYDMFTHFAERGQRFKDAVRTL
jgi:UDP-N-acetylmuramoylalanine--D-glutamate ligase